MSHQDRREPLPAEYQYPTHGVDCDCPPCRERFLDWNDHLAEKLGNTTALVVGLNIISRRLGTAYGWGV